MNTSRSSAGFPAMFTTLVAEASMKLPPLTQPEHFAFLKDVQDIVIAGFWERYLAGCSQEARAELEAAVAKQDFPAVQTWYGTHANFSEDSVAAKKADALLDEIKSNLESMIQEAYKEQFATS